MCRKSRENCRVENILTGGLFQIKVTQPSGRLGMVKGGEDSSQGIGMGTTQDATRTSEAMANGFSEAIVNAKTPRNEERGCLLIWDIRMVSYSHVWQKAGSHGVEKLVSGRGGDVAANMMHEWVKGEVYRIAFRFSSEAKRWWNAKKVLLVQDFGSEEGKKKGPPDF